MQPGGLMLITMVLVVVVILAGTAGAHTYNPDKEMCWTVDCVDETDL